MPRCFSSARQFPTPLFSSVSRMALRFLPHVGRPAAFFRFSSADRHSERYHSAEKHRIKISGGTKPVPPAVPPRAPAAHRGAFIEKRTKALYPQCPQFAQNYPFVPARQRKSFCRTAEKSFSCTATKKHEKRGFPLFFPFLYRLQKLSQQVQCSQSQVLPTWMVVSSQCIPSRLYLQSVTPQETPVFILFILFFLLTPWSICNFRENIAIPLTKTKKACKIEKTRFKGDRP